LAKNNKNVFEQQITSHAVDRSPPISSNALGMVNGSLTRAPKSHVTVKKITHERDALTVEGEVQQ
jgi:hypothetical protein